MVEIEMSEIILLAIIFLPAVAFLIYLWLKFFKAPLLRDFFLTLAFSIVSLAAIPLAMFIMLFMIMFFFDVVFRR